MKWLVVKIAVQASSEGMVLRGFCSCLDGLKWHNLLERY